MQDRTQAEIDAWDALEKSRSELKKIENDWRAYYAINPSRTPDKLRNDLTRVILEFQKLQIDWYMALLRVLDEAIEGV